LAEHRWVARAAGVAERARRVLKHEGKIVTDSKPLAVVTGASSGIGRELARQFATNGFDVIVAAEYSELVSAVDDLAATGADIQPVRPTWPPLAASSGCWRRSRPPAGMWPRSRSTPVSATAARSWTCRWRTRSDLIDLNIGSTVHLAKRLLPDMVARGAGRVLFTSSVASQMPGPYYATYAASKAFIQSFAQALRYELKDTGVTVTALLPGPIDTEFFERAGMEGTPVNSSDKDDPADVARDGLRP
jgi:short-subunit dehydrogenase